MGMDKKLTYKKLSRLWANNEVTSLKTSGVKYVIISDLHLGDGGSADDVRHNKEALSRALDHYRNEKFKLILLGDIEELWQFDIEQIVGEYRDNIYKKIRGFGQDRVYRVLGNHDMDWDLRDPITEGQVGDRRAVEALKMTDKDNNPCILLVHGHQGSNDADKNSWISRIFVKRIWKPLEPLAVKLKLYGHPSATKSQIAKDYEKILYAWAKEKKAILICGHSHRAIYASKSYIDKLENDIRKRQADIMAHRNDRQRVKKNIKEIERLNKILAEEKLKGREINPTERNKKPLPCYFNCGCGLFTDGVTALEINNDIVRLVKWHKKPKGDQLFEVYNDGDGQTLSDFIQSIKA